MKQETREDSLIANIQLCKIQFDEIDAHWRQLGIHLLVNGDAYQTDNIFSENENVSLVINVLNQPSGPRVEYTLGAEVELENLKRHAIRHVQLIFNFLAFLRNIESLLAEAAAEAGFQTLGEPDRKLWEKMRLAQDELTDRVFYITPFFGGEMSIQRLFSIGDVLRKSLEILENNPDLHTFGEVELKRAKAVLQSGYFEPDRWVSNLSDLDVVTGAQAGSRLPGSIRLRLKEIYQSYFFGNHLSAIALTRATLEYAIKDRGASIGVLTKQQDGRDISLSIMIESLSNARPELREHLEAIRESGNRTLHPIKKERLFLDEEYVQCVALNCITGLREILETIYFRTP